MRIGYVNFYLLTTAAAVPGIMLFWIMMRMGLIDQSIGTAGDGRASGDVRADASGPGQAGVSPESDRSRASTSPAR